MLSVAMAEGCGAEAEPATPAQDGTTQGLEDRRLLRSQYLAVKGQINGTAVSPRVSFRWSHWFRFGVLGSFGGFRFEFGLGG